MKNLTSLSIALLTSNLLVGCVAGDNEMPADDQDQDPGSQVEKVAFPKTCAEKAKGNPTLADGEYKLYLANDEQHQWTAYCVDLQSASPKEYLTLPSGGDLNTAEYRAGGFSPGVDVVTKFDKIRIDPITLKVDIADLTFATSEGEVMHMGTTKITSMNLGIVMSCEAGNRGHGQIDLQGTPFGIVDRFTSAAGIGHHGIWENGQVIELSGGPDGGDCGWTAPAPVGYDAPLDLAPGSWDFALTYL